MAGKNVKASRLTRFGRAERKSLSDAGRKQAGLKPRRAKAKRKA